MADSSPPRRCAARRDRAATRRRAGPLEKVVGAHRQHALEADDQHAHRPRSSRAPDPSEQPTAFHRSVQRVPAAPRPRHHPSAYSTSCTIACDDGRAGDGGAQMIAQRRGDGARSSHTCRRRGADLLRAALAAPRPAAAGLHAVRSMNDSMPAVTPSSAAPRNATQLGARHGADVLLASMQQVAAGRPGTRPRCERAAARVCAAPRRCRHTESPRTLSTWLRLQRGLQPAVRGALQRRHGRDEPRAEESFDSAATTRSRREAVAAGMSLSPWSSLNNSSCPPQCLCASVVIPVSLARCTIVFTKDKGH